MNGQEVWTVHPKKMSINETGKPLAPRNVAWGALLLLLLSFISSQSNVSTRPASSAGLVSLSSAAPTTNKAQQIVFNPKPDAPVQYLAVLGDEPLTNANEAPGTAEIIVSETYLDKLIDPEGPAEDDLIRRPYAYKQPGVLANISPGQLGLEYRYFRTDLGGDVNNTYQEHGVGITVRQDTVDYGQFELESAIINQDSTSREDSETGSSFRLLQNNYYLTDELSMDNRLGHVRTRTSNLISNSHHLRLPQPIIEGGQSRLSFNKLSLSVAGGDLGTLQGRTFQDYNNDINPGSVAGLDAIYTMSRDIKFALQGWNVQGARLGNETTDHTSITGAVAYQYRPLKLDAQLHYLGNNTGANGIWLDSAYRQANGFSHKLGLFRLDTDLIWIDNSNQINADRQGLYWEGNLSRSRIALHLGADYYQTNLDDDPALATHVYTSIFTNIFYRLYRNTSVGGGLSYLNDNNERNNLTEVQDIIRVTGNIGQKTFAGNTTFRLKLSDSSGDMNNRSTYEGILDHGWSFFRPANLRTGISYFNQDQENEESLQQTSIRLFGSYPFNRVNIAGGVTAGVSGSGDTENGRSSSANFNLGWSISNAWQLRMDYTYSRFNTRLINNQEVLINEQTASLSLRYNTNWGQRYHVLGKKNGAHGSGRIMGTVFLDANRNGIQEPSEPGTPNVVVYLDGIYSTETDATGRYEFWPVASGEHKITLDVSNVPLPWILEDEAPRLLTVHTRSEVNTSYGLINPSGR